MGICPVICLTAPIIHTGGAQDGQGTISSTRLLLAHRTYSYHHAITHLQDPIIRPVLLQVMLLPASTNEPFSSPKLELNRNHLQQLHKSGFGNGRMPRTCKAQDGKEKEIQHWTFRILKIFVTSKELINEGKAESTRWETIFANHVSDRGSISTTYRDHINSTTRNKLNVMCECTNGE